ncbi:XRE family transcriptional regulator [Ornithinimicrobium sp. INDO-MA30-4]|uniref:XRE family transcriptional regulator n=1 Tax=Ornithinimicrobium sp. INDO-MA30-4 TaxID=2908651 RepID=UPI001F41D679|nr:ImmA/IrrE family metallo-endopeptidase [Ornithinimicrobium sp. INDO-MA30-4]UJH70064.1 ImmA/IrrE family metallo-endopeptidase [Ornithinimicrobium sp. INDO-MA30-4]
MAESQRATSEQVRLLALWDTAEDGAAVKLRVVHPLVPGIYGSKVPIDLSYEIVPSGGSLPRWSSSGRRRMMTFSQRLTVMRTRAMSPLVEKQPRGARLLALRHLEGLSQGDLAVRLSVSQSFISQVEKHLKPLPREVIEVACREFQLPEQFFGVSPGPSETGVATFRKSSKASVRDENYVKAMFGEAARLFRIASQSSGYRAADLSRLSMPEEEEAAELIRESLGLDPHVPIPNVTRALERLGVGVIHQLAPRDVCDLDHFGMSRPSASNDRPLVTTVGSLPPAVSRMTLLHELGHLIYDESLSVPIPGTRSPEELRAFRFASAMLMPAAVVRSRITESLTLHGYLRVKADYGISVAALIKRASDLRVISRARARSLYIQHSSQGWRRVEPVAVAAEEPRLLSQAIRRGLGNDPEFVASRTGVKQSLVHHWTDLDFHQSEQAKVLPFRRPTHQ